MLSYLTLVPTRQARQPEGGWGVRACMPYPRPKVDMNGGLSSSVSLDPTLCLIVYCVVLLLLCIIGLETPSIALVLLQG